MVETRIRALGEDAYEQLLNEGRRHYRGSETERAARQATADHFDSEEDEGDDDDD